MAEVRHDLAEAFGIEGGVADERRLDSGEEIEEEIFMDQPVPEHGFHVRQIAAVPPFQFGECLAVWIVVVKVELAVAGDEEASFPPVGQFRNEVRWTGQFDVQGKFILDGGDRLEEAGGFGIRLEIHIHGHGSPAVKQRGRATGQVDAAGSLGFPAHGSHEGVQAGDVDRRAHEGLGEELEWCTGR